MHLDPELFHSIGESFVALLLSQPVDEQGASRVDPTHTFPSALARVASAL